MGVPVGFDGVRPDRVVMTRQLALGGTAMTRTPSASRR